MVLLINDHHTCVRVVIVYLPAKKTTDIEEAPEKISLLVFSA
jgi:hypothetical protein